ncbi:hypothetical protein M3Y95_00783600 [Aphelenchoides besseyi]|nr:hypothetical protein M3Y95_00783600 [Aphelenchoides besseyi]
MLFRGTVDFVNYCMKIKSAIIFDGDNNALFLDDIKSHGYVLTRFMDTPEHPRCSTIRITDSNLSVTNVCTLPFDVQFPTVRDNTLYAFCSNNDSLITTTKLLEFSFIDGTFNVHMIEKKDQLKVLSINKQVFLWINDKLFIANYNFSSDISTIVEFDLANMRWTKTNMEVKGTVTKISITGKVLTVHSREVGEPCCSNAVYQFHLGEVDSLANLIWSSMQRYAQFNPQFKEWYVSKLTTNSAYRPLW